MSAVVLTTGITRTYTAGQVVELTSLLDPFRLVPGTTAYTTVSLLGFRVSVNMPEAGTTGQRDEGAGSSMVIAIANSVLDTTTNGFGAGTQLNADHSAVLRGPAISFIGGAFWTSRPAVPLPAGTIVKSWAVDEAAPFEVQFPPGRGPVSIAARPLSLQVVCDSIYSYGASKVSLDFDYSYGETRT